GPVGEVGLDEEGPAPERLRVAGDRARPVLALRVVDDDIAPGDRERAGDDGAQAGAGAGDEGSAPVEGDGGHGAGRLHQGALDGRPSGTYGEAPWPVSAACPRLPRPSARPGRRSISTRGTPWPAGSG